MSSIVESLYRLAEATEMKFANHIDSDLIKGANGEFGDGSNLSPKNIKCSWSAVNNLMWFLKKGQNCSLCLGEFNSIGQNMGHVVTHVWVEAEDGTIIQTHVPREYDEGKLELNEIKRMTFTPEDLDNLESKVRKLILSV